MENIKAKVEVVQSQSDKKYEEVNFVVATAFQMHSHVFFSRLYLAYFNLRSSSLIFCL